MGVIDLFRKWPVVKQHKKYDPLVTALRSKTDIDFADLTHKSYDETYQGSNFDHHKVMRKDKYFKKGKFVQVKTKLGRNRPTKLY
tara:strand:- start:2026 stop:2280 length:255 start_codon:yes stop_codon:yes gene_type:complete